jgi:hypothetical protein
MIRNKRLILLLNTMLFSFSLLSQVPVVQWQKTFGGTNDDEAFSILVLPDNNYVVAGFSSSNNGDVIGHHNPPPGFYAPDFWIIKIDNLGNLLWNKSFGGQQSDVANSIVITKDNGFTINGYTSSHDGDVLGLHGFSDDAWVVKTDSLGNILWQKCFGSYESDNSFQIINTTDSGYIFIGETNSNDGDLAGAGYHGNQDALVIKISKNGTRQWTKSLGGSSPDGGRSIQQMDDGGFLIASSTNSNDGNVSGLHNSFSTDVWVVKLDSVGSIKWQKCYGGIGSDFPSELVLTHDGGAAILATASSNDGDVTNPIGGFDLWLIRIDSIGNIIFQKCLGSIYDEISESICTTSDGGFAVVGDVTFDNGMVNGTHGSSDFWLCKVDSVGNFEWGKALGGAHDEHPYSVKETLDGGFIVAGSTTSSNTGDVGLNHGSKDFWVVKLSPPGLSVSEIDKVFLDLTVFQINDHITLRFFSKKNLKTHFSIYNMDGKNIFSKNIHVNAGLNYDNFEVTDFASGIYFLDLNGEHIKFIVN